jgi:NADPH-dependent 2,4-dienoyl-CoA reductase/sulfur reductase-like enzyme
MDRTDSYSLAPLQPNHPKSDKLLVPNPGSTGNPNSTNIVSEQIDCAVVGAGVVGLAVARALVLAGRDVIVIETEDAIGTHTS